MAKLKDYTGNQVDKVLKPKTEVPKGPVKPKMSPAPVAPKEDVVYRRDPDTGKINGIEFSDGRSFTGLDPRDALRLAAGYKRSLTKTDVPQEIPETPPVVPELAQPSQPDLINQIGQLNPAQEAQANADPTLPGSPNTMNILKTAGERAAIGAAGGALTGAVAGSVVPGLGNLAGAGIGAVGGGLVGGVSAIFTEYRKTGAANLKTASDNYDFARDNMDEAITLASKGLGYKSNSLAIKNYNAAQAQIDFAESQLKELSKKNPGDTKIIEKLTQIRDYRKNDKPRLDILMAAALQKPTASYVGGGVK